MSGGKRERELQTHKKGRRKGTIFPKREGGKQENSIRESRQTIFGRNAQDLRNVCVFTTSGGVEKNEKEKRMTVGTSPCGEI